jgi:phosphopantothenoylcysteine decarboxylase/phosphopantothenate--cysteine ligase
MSRPFQGRRVLLGVTGGIACYKSLFVARQLTQAGAEVDVILTRAAREFVGAITFEALTGRPVLTELLAAGHALDHIRLPRAADVVVVAPATADFLARAVHGHGDDLLAASLLAATAPVLLVPAMNDHMWANRQVRANVARARELGFHVLDPDEGPLAVGEGSGPGRMPEPDVIVEHVARLLERPGALSGRRVVVTAGPTRERVDPVRFLSNFSSGLMGVEVARAAWRRGAEVTLVCGPVSVPLPRGPRIIRVESTADMERAVRAALPDADALVMAAAPADFRPASPAGDKIKKSTRPDAIALEPTPDILLATRDARKPGAVVVGFALETRDAVAYGRGKLAAKGLDLVVVNDATEEGAGFGVPTNKVTLVTSTSEEALPLMSKRDVADAILDRVEAALGALAPDAAVPAAPAPVRS